MGHRGLAIQWSSPPHTSCTSRTTSTSCAIVRRHSVRHGCHLEIHFIPGSQDLRDVVTLGGKGIVVLDGRCVAMCIMVSVSIQFRNATGSVDDITLPVAIQRFQWKVPVPRRNTFRFFECHMLEGNIQGNSNKDAQEEEEDVAQGRQFHGSVKHLYVYIYTPMKQV